MPGKSHGQRNLEGYHPWGHSAEPLTLSLSPCPRRAQGRKQLSQLNYHDVTYKEVPETDRQRDEKGRKIKTQREQTWPTANSPGEEYTSLSMV